GDSATTGVVVFAATTSGVVEMSKNTVTTNGNVQVQGSDLADGTMLASGNEFTNLTAEPGGFVMLASNGSCVVTDNVLAFDDPSDATVQSATFLCLGTG